MTVYDENAVPVLYRGPDQTLGMSEAGTAALDKAKAAALKAFEDASTPEEIQAAQDKHYLLAHVAIVHNSDSSDARPFASFNIGGSTLDEAVKEVIAAFDTSHVGPQDESADHRFPPDWVASTHKDLARHLADYYGCEVREMAEVIG